MLDYETLFAVLFLLGVFLLTDLFFIIDLLFEGDFSINFLWSCLLYWFPLATRFYYTPAACAAKQLLIFNTLGPPSKNMKIWTPDQSVRLLLF